MSGLTRHPVQRDRPRLIVAGTGGYGRTLLDAIAASGAFELAAIVDVDDAARRQAAERRGVEGFDALPAALRAVEADAVVIATPNDTHEGLVLQALEAGRHVFVEKPLAVDTRACLVIAGAAERSGRVVQTGHNTRFAAVTRQLKAALDERVIGVPAGFDAHFSHDAALQGGTAAWKLDPVRTPLLPMTQLGVHLIDLIRHLLGEIASVSAATTHRALRQHDGTPVDDCSVALLELADGLCGSIQAHYVTPERLEFRVFGTLGSVTARPDGFDLLHRAHGALHSEHVPAAAPFGASVIEELRQFARAVRGEIPCPVPPRDAAVNVAVLDAMRRAADAGGRIRISDILESASA